MTDVVVVGAGLAGVRTCALLRSAGHSGRLIVLGAEPDPPYDRPPLTKDPGADVDLRSAMGLDLWEHADEVRLGVRALRVVPTGPGSSAGRWVVVDGEGRQFPAAAVVLAVGADPLLPAGWSRPGVHLLHTRDQARSWWSGVGPGTRVAIVGGGWVGCEAAATAAARGAQVLLWEADDRLLGGRVPQTVAEVVGRWLTETGVDVHLGVTVTSVAPGDPHLQVDGVPADRVLVALGVRPATRWLADSPLTAAGLRRAPDGAMLVDEVGRTGAAGVFATGDCAARWSPRRGTYLPGGHWTEALSAPERLAPAVADWVAGAWNDGRWAAPVRPPAADPIPYVFSDIAGRTLQLLGAPEAGRPIWRAGGGDGPEAWTCFSVDRQDRLVGLCTVGRPRDLSAARRAMLAHPAGTPRVDVTALGDPAAAPASMFLVDGD